MPAHCPKGGFGKKNVNFTVDGIFGINWDGVFEADLGKIFEKTQFLWLENCQCLQTANVVLFDHLSVPSSSNPEFSHSLNSRQSSPRLPQLRFLR